jgi:hypothetical protein
MPPIVCAAKAHKPWSKKSLVGNRDRFLSLLRQAYSLGMSRIRHMQQSYYLYGRLSRCKTILI